jgi:hypothetical protein
MSQESSCTDRQQMDDKEWQRLKTEYAHHKKAFFQNLQFSPDSPTTKYSAESKSKLVMVEIYFSTPTYDEISRDVKNTLETQLAVIGGTMGLLTGFSILSGVEVVYFLIKYILSFRKVEI